MLELSPSDAELTKEFIRLINGRSSMGAMSLKPAEMTGFLDKLKTMVAILPSLGVFGKYGNQTIQEFAKRYKDPFLRDAVRFFIDSPGWPMLRFPMVAMAGFIKSAVLEAGVPLGGSQKVLFRMADYFKELGGEILYRNRVRDVIIEKDRAVGVGTEDGTEHLADIVVWADDGPANFGKFIAENLQNNNATVYFTEDNDELIAYILATIQYYPPVFEIKKYGLVNDLAVAMAYRRLGIGQHLFLMVKDWFAKKEISRIEIEVSLVNETSISFWRKMNFRPYKEIQYLEL